MKELTSQNVTDIFKKCLYNEAQPDVKTIVVEGIVSSAKFSVPMVNEYKQEIADMLSQLPDEFMTSKGGGWSFMNACVTKTGNMWTSLHQVMEQLFMLGMSVDMVICLLPRELWSALPGGVPYYQVLDVPKQEKTIAELCV